MAKRIWQGKIETGAIPSWQRAAGARKLATDSWKRGTLLFDNKKYSDEWKIACLEFLRAKREKVRLEIGHKRLGWDVVRNWIMKPYDQAIAPQTSDQLNASTLEAWHSRGNASITDEKFRFVDEYIRRLAVTGDDNFIVEMTRRERFLQIAKNLFRVYCPKFSEDGGNVKDSELPDWARTSGKWDLSGGHGCMLIKFIGSFHGAIHMICALTPTFNLEETLPDVRDVLFFEGVAVPVTPEILQEDLDGHVMVHYLVKLFRDEFSGLSALGYADGEMCTSSMPDHDNSVQVELFRPSSWFHPKRLIPTDPMWQNQFMINTALFATDEFKVLARERWNDTGMIGINSHTDNNQKIDNFFAQYYVGYQ